jgi:hypothetical protein
MTGEGVVIWQRRGPGFPNKKFGRTRDRFVLQPLSRQISAAETCALRKVSSRSSIFKIACTSPKPAGSHMTLNGNFPRIPGRARSANSPQAMAVVAGNSTGTDPGDRHQGILLPTGRNSGRLRREPRSRAVTPSFPSAATCSSATKTRRVCLRRSDDRGVASHA